MNDMAWGAVVISFMNIIGFLIAQWMKYHYKVIETPTKMSEGNLHFKCRELENTAVAKAVEQLGDVTAMNLRSAPCPPAGGKGEPPTNPG